MFSSGSRTGKTLQTAEQSKGVSYLISFLMIIDKVVTLNLGIGVKSVFHSIFPFQTQQKNILKELFREKNSFRLPKGD